MRSGVFESGLAADGGIGACAEASGNARADLHFVGDLRGFERLCVSVHDVELDAVQAFLQHAADSVGAAAADADYFDTRAPRRVSS